MDGRPRGAARDPRPERGRLEARAAHRLRAVGAALRLHPGGAVAGAQPPDRHPDDAGRRGGHERPLLHGPVSRRGDDHLPQPEGAQRRLLPGRDLRDLQRDSRADDRGGPVLLPAQRTGGGEPHAEPHGERAQPPHRPLCPDGGLRAERRVRGEPHLPLLEHPADERPGHGAGAPGDALRRGHRRRPRHLARRRVGRLHAPDRHRQRRPRHLGPAHPESGRGVDARRDRHGPGLPRRPRLGLRGILFVETDAAASRSQLVLVQPDGSGRTVLRTENATSRMGSPRWLPGS